MTRSTALGMLRVGNNGNDILAILDVIAADIESEKTINEIAEILFWLWYLWGAQWLTHSAPYVRLTVLWIRQLFGVLYVANRRA